MTDTALIVPIDVTALVVGKPDLAAVNGFAAVAANFAMLPHAQAPGPYLADPLLPRPFDSVSSQDALRAGIHLHWALPDAIARGTTSGVGKVIFNQAPNLWMVTRVATQEGSGTTVQTAWVIEGDYLWDPETTVPQNAYSRAVPIAPSPTITAPPFTYMGRVYRQHEWTGRTGGTYATSNTAVGYGTTSFAAAYPHCPNIFGFWDPLDDEDAKTFTPATKLSYSVSGWYSDTTSDPLGGLQYPPTAQTLEEKLAYITETFAWSVKDRTALPNRTICNGLLNGMNWDPDRSWLRTQAANGIDVVIADTTAEAVSALIQARNPDVPGLETLLNVFQQGMLNGLGQVGGAAAAEEAIHQSGFGAVPGGSIWVARPEPNPDGQSPTGDAARLPADAAAQLEQINRLQRNLDAMNGDLEAIRQQLFVDWVKFMMLQFGKVTNVAATADQARSFITNYDLAAYAALAGTRNTQGGIATAQAQIVAAVDSLRKALGEQWTLTTTSAARYWQPTDPVIMLAGRPTTQASTRHGGDGRFDSNGLLACRSSRQLATTLSVNGQHFTARHVLAAAPTGPHYPPELSALVTEALTLDPAHAPALARQFAAHAGPANLLGGSIDTTASAIAGAQHASLTAAVPAGSAVRVMGEVPSPVGLTAWQQPWIPMYMHWEARFYPFTRVGMAAGGAEYESDSVTRIFQLDNDGLDFDAVGTPQPDPNFQTYSGSLVLAGRTELTLQSQIDAYIASYPKDPNAAVLATIRDRLDLQAMAQSLTGFNQGLLMRSQSLQLPVMDALSPSMFIRGFTNDRVAPAVGDGNVASPAPNNGFNPLRSGVLTISRLRMVDAFGQAVDIDSITPIVAERLKGRGPDGQVANDGLIVLPPRITQPARLQFRWISAVDGQAEAGGDQGQTPICGWVLFNHLDASLMIYDADGSAIGSLNTLGPRWLGAPGSDNWNRSIDAVLPGVNPHLADFVRAVHNHPEGVAFLTALLATIDEAAAGIGPAMSGGDPGLSVLIGRPLAVVRSSLKLELLGQPAADESWEAFVASLKLTNPSAPRPTGGLGKLRFPVRLGDLGQYDDGLVGYFIEDGTASAWTTFYSHAATGQHGVAPVDIGKTALSPVATSSTDGSLNLTMLIDPRGEVNATAGIVPVKTISVPRAQWQPALDRISVVFLTTPMVGGGGVMPVPVPKQNGFSWSWVTRNPGDAGWTSQSPGPAVTTATLASPQRIEEGWLRLVRNS